MTQRACLGEIEHLVLATALRLESGYGAELVRELEDRAIRQVQPTWDGLETALGES